jgi:hypothetical protein
MHLELLPPQRIFIARMGDEGTLSLDREGWNFYAAFTDVLSATADV